MNIQLCEKCGTHCKANEDKIKSLVVTMRQPDKEETEPITKSITACQSCINEMTKEISHILDPEDLNIDVRRRMKADPRPHNTPQFSKV
jgi:hypothetical protein